MEFNNENGHDNYNQQNFDNMNIGMDSNNQQKYCNVNYQNNSPTTQKKNRTLQFYKFLFYSIKLEIKSQEFVKLINISNESEIILWILSLILYIATPKDFPKVKEGESKIYYKNAFIWFHLIHIVRAAIGIFVWLHLPRSYNLIEYLKQIPEERLSKTLFNDLAREQVNNIILSPIKEKKIFLFIYAGLTFLNFIFDVLDFLVVLASLDKATSDAKVVLMTYLMISVIYCIIDLSYLFWAGCLKYILPPQYTLAISDAFSGSIKKAMMKFKIGKPMTNIVKENNNNQQQQRLPELKNAIEFNSNYNNNNYNNSGEYNNNNNQQFGLDGGDEINEKDVKIEL